MCWTNSYNIGECVKWILRIGDHGVYRKFFWGGLNRLVRAWSLLGNVKLSICLSFRLVPLEGSADIQDLTFECFFAEIFPRDLRKKEKVIKHLTGERLLSFLWPQSNKGKQMCLRMNWAVFFPSGPLYFSPKCRKTVYRLYHNTRDCTIPACEYSQAFPSLQPHKQVTPLPTCTRTLYKLSLYSWQSQCRLGAPDLPLHMEF